MHPSMFSQNFHSSMIRSPLETCGPVRSRTGRTSAMGDASPQSMACYPSSRILRRPECSARSPVHTSEKAPGRWRSRVAAACCATRFCHHPGTIHSGSHLASAHRCSLANQMLRQTLRSTLVALFSSNRSIVSAHLCTPGCSFGHPPTLAASQCRPPALPSGL